MEHAKPHNPQDLAENFTSESSVIRHPYSFPKPTQLMFPTWALMLILIVSFFVLKYFIYIADDKRHGK